jgi:hypothetical protein
MLENDFLNHPSDSLMIIKLNININSRFLSKFYYFLAVKIKKNKDNWKFKVRCSRFLYTLVIDDNEKADKLKNSLPPGIFLFFIFVMIVMMRKKNDINYDLRK